MNEQKLIEAADWAEKNINPKMFNMEIFRDDSSKTPECNSVGCMVGHLTAIDAENVKNNYTTKYINFNRWSTDYFELNNYEWDYLFTGGWSQVDNTLEGAIARMRRLADGMSKKEIKLELKKIRL